MMSRAMLNMRRTVAHPEVVSGNQTAVAKWDSFFISPTTVIDGMSMSTLSRGADLVAVDEESVDLGVGDIQLHDRKNEQQVA